jgi:hypothetical protein
VSTLLHATVYMLLHNLRNVLVQTANEMGLQYTSIYIHKKIKLKTNVPRIFTQHYRIC